MSIPEPAMLGVLAVVAAVSYLAGRLLRPTGPNVNLDARREVRVVCRGTFRDRCECPISLECYTFKH